jgi:pimeloyl-ACP methyl ester carboxylesterase
MKKLQVGGLEIAYTEKGSGTPIVLLHGALSDSRTWKNQIAELSENFHVVAWDAPGCGHSSDPPETYSLTDYAECLASLIEHLELDRPHILGLSFGGGLALEFYRIYPKIPGSLILVSAYAGWAGSLPAREVEERLQNGLKQSEMPPEEVVKIWIPTLFTDSTPDDVVKESARIMSDFHPAGMRTMLRAFAKADLNGMLPEIVVPVLLLYGDTDQRSPLHIAQKLHSGIPSSKLVVLEGVGHVVHSEAPEKFNTAVREFLVSIDS